MTAPLPAVPKWPMTMPSTMSGDTDAKNLGTTPGKGSLRHTTSPVAASRAMRTGADEDLYGIWGGSATDVYAVGDLGAMIHYREQLPLITPTPTASVPATPTPTPTPSQTAVPTPTPTPTPASAATPGWVWPVAILIIILLVALVWFIVRWVRRRRSGRHI